MNKTIQLEIARCKEIEKVSHDRGLVLAEQEYAARRLALEWSEAQNTPSAPAPAAKPAAPKADTRFKPSPARANA